MSISFKFQPIREHNPLLHACTPVGGRIMVVLFMIHGEGFMEKGYSFSTIIIGSISNGSKTEESMIFAFIVILHSVLLST